MKKERVDVLCVEQGLFESREKAKRAIMAGLIHNDHERLDKPGMKISRDTPLFIKGEKMRYVSRGGLKLEKAIDYFKLDIQNQIMVDIGSSTGGFTDCALQHGIKEVYAIDVGTNQLDWKIRNDFRVHVFEQTNFRYVDSSLFQYGQPEFATIDVSFISLKHIFPPLSSVLKPYGYIVALIKPQFEAGREEVGKHGLIHDKAIHNKVIKQVINYANNNHMALKNLTYSPITGGSGNIEFLGLFENDSDLTHDHDIDIEMIVDEAHQHYEKG
ncbi:MAG: TlyA family RNA methyltransferase [Erysipelotrichaceae bacterium]|nr:TlyA family RNA methyltransferase [Erysipelotrichaceae bacterium]